MTVRVVFLKDRKPTCKRWLVDARPEGRRYFHEEAKAREKAAELQALLDEGNSLASAYARTFGLVTVLRHETIEHDAPWKHEYRKRMHESAKVRAEKAGVPFTIAPKHILIPDRCPALGIEIRPLQRGGKRTEHAPSLDRIIPELGYVPGNIVVISWRANRLKNDATAEELQKLSDWLRLEEQFAHDGTNGLIAGTSGSPEATKKDQQAGRESC